MMMLVGYNSRGPCRYLRHHGTTCRFSFCFLSFGPWVQRAEHRPVFAHDVTVTERCQYRCHSRMHAVLIPGHILPSPLLPSRGTGSKRGCDKKEVRNSCRSLVRTHRLHLTCCRGSLAIIVNSLSRTFGEVMFSLPNRGWFEETGEKYKCATGCVTGEVEQTQAASRSIGTIREHRYDAQATGSCFMVGLGSPNSRDTRQGPVYRIQYQ
ncbi:hypothetical protein GE09DRAFT_610514 [Coniochaeta sp. 2T2.1]|nr:hypothetical protein GE09DRAFT_610514 [Coniochaeta sp. 2T2.1]